MATELHIPDRPPQEVSTGEIAAASAGSLRADALGSCVAVALFDARARVGGVAHVMLPARPPSTRPHWPNRFADTAIHRLLAEMEALGGRRKNTDAALVGGADVLEGGRNPIGQVVLESVFRCLDELGIEVRATHVGGDERRTLILEVGSGCVLFTVGDSGPRLLWKASPPTSTSNPDP